MPRRHEDPVKTSRPAATIIVVESLGRGASLPDVMKILGHSQIETTMQYVNEDFSRMRKAMKALEEIVDKSVINK